jgi:hypothetical protein
MIIAIRRRNHRTPSLVAVCASFVVPLLSSCGDSDSSKDSQSPSIEGTWLSPCGKDSSGEDQWYQVKVTFSSSKGFESTKSAYSQANCADAKLDFSEKSKGTYNAEEGRLDTKILDLLGRPVSDKGLTLFNTLCPKIVFVKGNETSLKSCESISANLGKTDYGAYKKEGDVLYFGKGGVSYDGSTPEKRPKEFQADGFRRLP